MSLIPDEFCHLCFHPGHADETCMEEEWGTHCGCGKHVDREDRNNRLVVISGQTAQDLLRAAAERLREARLEYAETFVKAKNGLITKARRPATDEEARQMTVVATKDEITTREAEWQIALNRLQKDDSNG